MKNDRPKIVIARHGETKHNREGLVLGRTDSPLIQSAHVAVSHLASRVASLNIDLILCSALPRAVITAEAYAAQLNVPFICRNDLVELSCGEWEGKARSDVTQDVFSVRRDWNFRPPGGESYLDGEMRLKPFVSDLETKLFGKCVMIVWHASINRVFLKLWLDLAEEEALTIVLPHVAFYLIEPNGNLRLERGNGKVVHGLMRQNSYTIGEIN